MIQMEIDPLLSFMLVNTTVVRPLEVGGGGSRARPPGSETVSD